MRLTLRTMLAYMDEILEPADAEDIGKKIDESDLAKTVMHRTRDSMRRLRLGAPDLVGRGMGSDPNTVAEYLDNTLPAEQVPDFERVCLESDIHLAEVGACHQILTLVLGEPADVDTASRDRMYHTISQVDLVATQAPVATPAKPAKEVRAEAPATPADQPARRSKPEVPDYLREPRKRSRRMMAALLVLALAAGGILAAALSPDVRRQIAALMPGEGSLATKPNDVLDENRPRQDVAPDDQQSGRQGEMAPNGLEGDAAAMAAGQAPVDNKNRQFVDGDLLPPDNPDSFAGGDADAPPMPAENPAAGIGLAVPRVAENNGGLPPMPDDGMTQDADAMPAAPPARAVAVVPPAPGNFDFGPPAAPARAEASDTDRAAAEVPPADAIGRYLFKQDVLLRYDRRSEAWVRLPQMAALAAGDRLLAFPLFRPAIPLSTAVTIQPLDGVEFQLLPLDENGVPGVAVEFGRLLLFTAGKPRNQIRIRFGDREGLLTFGDGESTMALEVRRLLVPGEDPAKNAAPLAVDFYATSGAIAWDEAGNSFNLKAPAHKVLTSLSSENRGSEIPKWTQGEAPSVADQRGAAELERQLVMGRPVSLPLKELADDRRREVRAFATRAAAYLGEFDPFVMALNDSDQRNSWSGDIETLRSAMAQGPDMAQKVRAAFERHRRGDGAELYRLLWGYTPEQLADGAAAKLVDYLNHDSLDFRVLAFQNLSEITGATQGFRPEYTSAKRRASYLKWKERLKEGKIGPATAAASAGRGAAGKPGPRPEAPGPSE